MFVWGAAEPGELLPAALLWPVQARGGGLDAAVLSGSGAG